MKKLTGIAALVLSMSMLVSCGSQQVPEQVALSPEEAVKTTVSDFFDAIIDYDFDMAKDYVSNDEVVAELESSLDMSVMLDAMSSSMGVDAEDILSESVVNNMVKKLMSTIEYKIDDVKVDNDNAEATVTISIPDFSVFDYNTSDLVGMMEEAFGFDMSDQTALLQEYLDRKGITAAELATEFSGSSQEELMIDIFKTFSPEFEKLIDLMVDEVINQAKSGNNEETTGDIKLEKDSDGTWKIAEID